MDAGFGTHLHDDVALAEIDLYTDVLAAVGHVEDPLTPEEIDRALGLLPPVPEPEPEPHPQHRWRRPAHH